MVQVGLAHEKRCREQESERLACLNDGMKLVVKEKRRCVLQQALKLRNT